MNLLEEGSSWLADQMQAHASSDVVYRRGSLSATIAATRAKTEFTVPDLSGMLIPVTSHDFTFKASLLVLGGAVRLPQEGDIIEATFEGKLTQFEVHGYGANDGKPYRACDPYGHQLRVHTRKGQVLP